MAGIAIAWEIAMMPAQFEASIAPMRTAAAVALVLAGLIAAGAAEDPDISNRRAGERTAFSDAEVADGFFKTAFGAELPLGKQLARIRKFDGPVRVYLDAAAMPDRRGEIAAIVADIRARVRHLDIALTDERAGANMVVTLVRDRDLARTIARLYGPERALQIQTSLEPQCLSAFRKDEADRIVHSDVILAADTTDFVFYDCAYEEILQALGPINDTDTVPWTMFNDAVHMGFFDVYDQYILNILYDPRIRPGMDAETVRALLPQVLRDVRAWVASVNRPAK
jgi:hypothetical protein